jgi:hypothetical protein
MNQRQKVPLNDRSRLRGQDSVENTKCVPTVFAAVAPTTRNFFADGKINTLAIIEASADQMSSVREQFLEYASTLEFDLSFQGFKEEILLLPGNYSRPQAAFCLRIKILNWRDRYRNSRSWV